MGDWKLGYGILGVKKGGIWEIGGKNNLGYGRFGVKKLGIWDIGFPLSPASTEIE